MSGADLVAIIRRQRDFSRRTFGSHPQWRGLIAHLRAELVEVEETSGAELGEWVDVIILAIDGAWRSGATPSEIVEGITTKQNINERRRWPDWRDAIPDTPIEHIRNDEGER